MISGLQVTHGHTSKGGQWHHPQHQRKQVAGGLDGIGFEARSKQLNHRVDLPSEDQNDKGKTRPHYHARLQKQQVGSLGGGAFEFWDERSGQGPAHQNINKKVRQGEGKQYNIGVATDSEFGGHCHLTQKAGDST